MAEKETVAKPVEEKKPVTYESRPLDAFFTFTPLTFVSSDVKGKGKAVDQPKAPPKPDEVEDEEMDDDDEDEDIDEGEEEDEVPLPFSMYLEWNA